MLRQWRRRFKRAFKREITWLRTKLTARGRQRSAKKERQQRKRRSHRHAWPDGESLGFRSDDHWAWSLRVLADGEVIALVQAANPLSLLAIVEEQVLAHGDPVPPYSVVLRRSSNRKCLTVNSGLLGSQGAATSTSYRIDALRTVDRKIDLHLRRFGDSTSITVMTDVIGNPVSTRALLKTIFSGDTQHGRSS
jgi:hypothetical protein